MNTFTDLQQEALTGAERLEQALRSKCEDRAAAAPIRAASATHWAVLLGRELQVLPLWPTVGGACTCPAGAACRAAGRHPMIRGTSGAAYVGQGPSVDRKALDQVIAWYEDEPAAGVGLLVPDGAVAIHGDLEAVMGLVEPDRLPDTLEIDRETSSELMLRLDTGRSLPDDLPGGVRVRQPGDIVVAYAGPSEHVNVELQDIAYAPPAIAALTEAKPRAARDAELRLSATPPPVHWLCRDLGLAPGRPSVIAGFAGGGKSPFAQAFAVAVASGKPFLGMPVRQERVLWCAFEASAAAHRNLQRLARGAGVDPATMAIDAWSWRGRLTDRGAMAELRALVQREGYGLIIVDSYTSAVNCDHNSSAFGDTLRQLERLSDETGAVALVTMHTVKARPEATGSRDIAGHFSAVASSQTVITLTRPEPDRLTRFRVTCSRALYSPFEPFEVEFRDLHIPPRHETPSVGLQLVRAGASSVDQAVLEIVGAMPGANRATIVELSQTRGFGRNETDSALAELEKSGWLSVKKKTGFSNEYSICETPQ